MTTTAKTVAIGIIIALFALMILSSTRADAQDATTPSVIEGDCASVDIGGGYYLYYSPTNPNYFCVHPPTQAPEPIVGGGAQVPSTCALAPDQRFYCSPYGYLTAATLQDAYARGQLPLI